MMRALRNRKGRTAGYSGCRRCGDSWSWKEPHSTPYRDGRGCFPLCEECWQALEPAERVPYYEELWQDWQRQFAVVPPQYRAEVDKNYGPETHDDIIAAVLAGK